MAFDYRVRVPGYPLSRYVEMIFYARGRIHTPREQIAPTGSTVAGIVLGDPIRQTPAAGQTLTAVKGFVIGPHDRPIFNEPTGETFCVGVVATPVGSGLVFGVDPRRLRGRIAELTDAWPEGLGIRNELLGQDDPDRMLELTERRLAAAAASASAPARSTAREARSVDRCAAAAAALEADPTRPVASIAAELGISHGHLDREFARVVGLTPRALSRILRMRRLLESIDPRRPVRWTEQAARWGWFDQAHLIRDFKRHTGVTPSGYLAAQRSYAEGDEGPGFVPEIAGADGRP